MQILSGDLQGALVEPIDGGIRYSANLSLWRLFLPIPWQFAEVTKLEFVSLKTSGGETYSTPGVSVTSYALWGVLGLCLAEDERHQKPLVQTVTFDCTLSDGRHFRAEASPQEWDKWQAMAAKPFAPPAPAQTHPRPLSHVTVAALYVLFGFLLLAVAGIIGEALTNAMGAK